MFLIVAAWFAYSLARSLSGDNVAAAVHRGRVIQNWDQAIGFGWTMNFNHWITAHNLFAIPLSIEYASLHYVVTPLVLVWLWRFHPETYRPALTALLTMSAIGLAVYIALPVAPPRLLPDSGWMDTLRSTSNFGWWGTGGSAPAGFEHFTDQFAAMPSLHVGWAVWCAWAWRQVGGRVARAVGWIYPASVAVTVIGTANHYALDVLVGTALSLAACYYMPRVLARLQNGTWSGVSGRSWSSFLPGFGARPEGDLAPSRVGGFTPAAGFVGATSARAMSASSAEVSAPEVIDLLDEHPTPNRSIDLDVAARHQRGLALEPEGTGWLQQEAQDD